MKFSTFITITSIVTALLAACSTVPNPMEGYEQLTPATDLEPPAPAPDTSFTGEAVARGKYLVGLLGCPSCHTNGALIGEPDPAYLLAGSDTGIAYSNPLVQKNPGVVYPANLTPDIETGIGSWTPEQLVVMIQTGKNKHGGQSLPVMPWQSYARLAPADVTAIAAYLKSLPPVRHQVPNNVMPGGKARAPYVHFGVYRSKR